MVGLDTKIIKLNVSNKVLYLVQSLGKLDLTIKLVPFVSGISYHKLEVQDTKGYTPMKKEIKLPNKPTTKSKLKYKKDSSYAEGYNDGAREQAKVFEKHMDLHESIEAHTSRIDLGDYQKSKKYNNYKKTLTITLIIILTIYITSQIFHPQQTKYIKFNTYNQPTTNNK